MAEDKQEYKRVLLLPIDDSEVVYRGFTSLCRFRCHDNGEPSTLPEVTIR